MKHIPMVNLWYRLNNVEELTRATMKKLTQGMAEHSKAMAAAKSDEAKGSIVSLSLDIELYFGDFLLQVSYLSSRSENSKAECHNWIANLQ